MVMTFDDWIRIGYESGWCSPVVCYSHDGLPMTEAEDQEWVEGHDPCIHIVRMYEDDITRKAVERNSSYFEYRKPS